MKIERFKYKFINRKLKKCIKNKMVHGKETYENIEKYGHIEVGKYYKFNGIELFNTVAQVISIRIWSDGIKDVQVRHGDITTSFGLEFLLRKDAETSEPVFREITLH